MECTKVAGVSTPIMRNKEMYLKFESRRNIASLDRPPGGINTHSHMGLCCDSEYFTDGRRAQRQRRDLIAAEICRDDDHCRVFMFCDVYYGLRRKCNLLCKCKVQRKAGRRREKWSLW